MDISKDIMKNMLNKAMSTSQKKKIAKLLKVSPEMYEQFEKSYRDNILSDNESVFSQDRFDNDHSLLMRLKKMRGEQSDSTSSITVEKYIDLLSNKIVNELIERTERYVYDGEKGYYDRPKKTDAVDCCENDNYLTAPVKKISSEDIYCLPKELRPQLTGYLMQKDYDDISASSLLVLYDKYLKTHDKKYYYSFRQGLDFIDLDEILYEMLGMNKSSIQKWFPKLVEARHKYKHDFFLLPKTTIIKVPLPMLQLSRLEYFSLTQTSLNIVDRFCHHVFNLDDSKDYFIKTGTFSSKFDFRNAHVHGEKEVRELGEYLLYIQHQASMMASPLAKPTIFGVSTTNEWVVREYIQDAENNPTIYKGMPLRTEFRVFVDMDDCMVIGISPYWEPETMKKRFGHEDDRNSPHKIHDYIIYQMHEEKLTREYEQYKDIITEKIEEMLPDIDLSGQWSIDIMKNGDDFYIIDMALAQNSALIECVPENLLKYDKAADRWLPENIILKKK